MSFVGEDDQADTLTIDEATIDPSALTSQLQHIDGISVVQEVEEQGGECISLDDLQYENIETCSAEVSDEVMTIETMAADQPEEVEIQTEDKLKPVSLPPLRPLTIAPKPAKIPVSFKPVAGQQLLLVQGAGSGQLKLVNSPMGLNVTNVAYAKAGDIKQTGKSGTISLVSPKKVVMKKVVPKPITKAFDAKTGQQIVLQKSDSQVKLLPTTAYTKTLTLSEAQQFGIISGSGGKKIIVQNKNQAKQIKIIPTKLVSAPAVASSTGTTPTSTKAMPQRIYLKQAGGTQAATHLIPGQIIQVPNVSAGQLHQINIPGKGLQYIKFVHTMQPVSSGATVKTTTTTPTAAPKITAKVSPAPQQLAKQVIKVATKPVAVTQSPVRSVITPVSPSVVNRALAMSPTKQAVPVARSTPKTTSGDAVVPKIASPELSMESNGIKTRKPCNCAKSQCLKLYCDCFANGEFCFMCNCTSCYNNIENEEQRQRAIKNCLERNPNAFRPKIGKGKDTGEEMVRKHTKGCNCKRSGCLKNYCECYEAKIACSNNCKCMGCMNVETAPLTIGGIDGSRSSESSPVSTKKILSENNKRKSIARQPSNYIKGAVIEATSTCLISIANNAEDSGKPEETTKTEIIEEFGRCLKQIIDCSLGKNSSQI